MSEPTGSYTTLIDPSDLLPRISDPDWVVVDCRFSLADTTRGSLDYRQAHIPGAVYMHLDDDLSGSIIPGRTGRHPLPDVKEFAELLGRKGIHQAIQIVAYDDLGGGVAARFWWMMRWLGHQRVAVLDGGWPAWQRSSFPVEEGVSKREPSYYRPRLDSSLAVDAAFVETIREDPNFRLVDARAAERYRGEKEPIDPVAGHIPGSVSLPYAQNLDQDQRFLPRDRLRERFRSVLDQVPPDRVVCYCGSGVTAAHDLLAMEYAGLGMAKLYPGSWSEWITDPEKPIARDIN